MNTKKTISNCPICERIVPNGCWEKHHLIPKSKKGKEIIKVCISCGDALHKIFTLKDMKNNYNNIEIINQHPDIQKWKKWISKKPNDFNICMKSKKRK
jgi:hypothetical protein